MPRAKTYEMLLNELKASGVGWKPGMSLYNTNGGIDPSTEGYQYTIQTTTLIRAKVIQQKFYEIPFADYVPVVVGEGAYLENIKTNVVYQSAGDFESGLQTTGSGTRITNVEVGVAPITAVIKTWLGGYEYSDLEVEKALASDNWNIIESKHAALKKRWDLGVQLMSFLGSYTDPTGAPGLLTSAAVTVNTSVITQDISTMSYTQFGTLVATILGTYFSNSNSTVLPDHFEVPMSDWLGLITPINPQFPNVSMLTYLEDAFKRATSNPNFVIYPTAYGDAANNKNYINIGTGKYRYCLYRKDPEVVRMDIPLDFVLRAPMSPNNFQWNGVAIGQVTGAVVYRPPEMIYFDHS
jgi:hypothetical protein